jgi:hypothetical protein
MLSTIHNKIAFCEHKTGVFHFNVLQILNKLLHIKMCPLVLRHPILLISEISAQEMHLDLKTVIVHHFCVAVNIWTAQNQNVFYNIGDFFADVEWITYQQTWISHKNHAFILCVSASFLYRNV